jgi:hypothetical protein
MATVVEYATTAAMGLLEQLPPTDKRTYRRPLKELKEYIGAGITTYILSRYTEPASGRGWLGRRRQVAAVRKHTDCHAKQPEVTIQRFLDDYIPNWPVFATYYLNQERFLWEEWLLALTEEEAEDA